ncbi:hypothetical protein [Georgenia sp. SUBG003]|uniref:hypothetical protein n=1 Tax=Georgenia sp. SUBG003 TaxID=1497974 RepID=UPI003AB35119
MWEQIAEVFQRTVVDGSMLAALPVAAIAGAGLVRVPVRPPAAARLRRLPRRDGRHGRGTDRRLARRTVRISAASWAGVTRSG